MTAMEIPVCFRPDICSLKLAAVNYLKNEFLQQMWIHVCWCRNIDSRHWSLVLTVFPIEECWKLCQASPFCTESRQINLYFL